jgi:hypothetical protein
MTDTGAALDEKLLSKSIDLESGMIYVVGVIIFRPAQSSAASDPYKLLVVKRVLDEEAFSDNWELPGGHVEPRRNHQRMRGAGDGRPRRTGLMVNHIFGGELTELRWMVELNVQFNYLCREGN